MSVHKNCGEKIRWAKNAHGDRFLPPLEFVGHYYILLDMEEGDDKMATEVSCYEVHQCDPEKVVAWQEYKDNLAAIESRTKVDVERPPSNWEIARKREQEATRARAEKKPCSKCGAKRNEPCFNLSIWKSKQEKRATNMPHTERMDWL